MGEVMKVFLFISFFTLSVLSSLAHAESCGGSGGMNGGNGAQSVSIYRCVYIDRRGQEQDVFVPQYFCDSNGGKTIL